MLASATSWSGFVAAPIDALVMPAPTYEVYLPGSGGQELVLYRGRHVAIGPEDIQHLRNRGVERVFLLERDLPAFRQELRERVLHPDAEVNSASRAAASLFLARSALQDAYASPKCERLIQASRALAEDITQFLSDESLRLPELLGLLEHDYQTYTHVCNVSVYCVLLARRLGISNTAELEEIAAGGLLHDVGKRAVPARLINKRGKLSDEEWELVCRHPADGYRELVGRPEISWGMLMMVYQHHERFDGSGYPTAILADEIHPWARICMVADVFDALTCDRPYRPALPVRDVCRTLRKQAAKWFDVEVVECLCAEMEELACHES